jgi:glycine/D-amino acid oxidase-like deaminating enzyme
MRILLVGAGGVGAAATGIAARRTFFERFVVADYDAGRAEKAVATAATWSSTATTSRPRSPSGPPSRSASTRR